MYQGFEETRLNNTDHFYVGRLPERLIPPAGAFEELWSLHPSEFHEIMMHGRRVKTPRWQQAYGRDYHYTGRTNPAQPVPDTLRPFLDWACKAIDCRVNGILLNWYDAALKHYIGAHRDSRAKMIVGAPIVTISLGDERVFSASPTEAGGRSGRFRREQRGSVHHAIRNKPQLDPRGSPRQP